MRNGASQMQIAAMVPTSIIAMVQAFIIFFLSADVIFRWIWQRKPAPEPVKAS